MPVSVSTGFRDLRVKILLLAAGGVIATAGVGSFELLEMRNALREQATADQQAVARTFAAVVSEHLDGVRGIVTTLAEAPAVRTPLLTDQLNPDVHGIPADVDALRRATLHGGVDAGGGAYAALAFWNINGDAYMFEPFDIQKQQTKPNYSDSASYQRATKSGTFAWGDATVSTRTGSVILTFSTPVKDAAGKPFAILGGAMDLDALAKRTSEFKLGQTGQVMLFDSQGFPLVYPDPQRIMDMKPLTDQPLVASALAGSPGFLVYHNPLTNVDEVGTILKLDNGNYAAVTQAQSEAYAAADGVQRFLLEVLAACLLALGLLAWFVQRSISRSVQAVGKAAAGLAEGDVDQEVQLESNDDLGRMATAFQQLIAYQRRMAEVADAIASGDLSHDIEPQSERDRLGLAFQRMTRHLREMVGQVQRTAQHVAIASNDVGQTTTHVGEAAQRVSGSAQTVASGANLTSRSAQETSESVMQLVQAVDGIARGAAEQARQVQAASETAGEMADGVEEVAQRAQSVAETSQTTRQTAETGAQAVRDTVAGMAEIKGVVSAATERVLDLGKLGDKIGAVVETIDDIAEQTNLLALNAAIEAARAGEHGRGFAVVADEVRKLAERAGRETRQITDLIKAVQVGTSEAVAAMQRGSASVEQGTTKANQAGQALEQILRAVEVTVRQVSEIAASSQQMARGARSVTAAMESISAVVEENTASTEEMAAQTGQVSAAIQSISSVASDQSAATEEVSASAQEMSAQVAQMSTQARELAATAEQLESLVAHFNLERAAEAAPDNLVAIRGAGSRTGLARTSAPRPGGVAA
jgi:methyl-accepting chemotaxis protein